MTMTLHESNSKNTVASDLALLMKMNGDDLVKCINAVGNTLKLLKLTCSCYIRQCSNRSIYGVHKMEAQTAYAAAACTVLAASLHKEYKLRSAD